MAGALWLFVTGTTLLLCTRLLHDLRRSKIAASSWPYWIKVPIVYALWAIGSLAWIALLVAGVTVLRPISWYFVPQVIAVAVNAAWVAHALRHLKAAMDGAVPQGDRDRSTLRFLYMVLCLGLAGLLLYCVFIFRDTPRFIGGGTKPIVSITLSSPLPESLRSDRLKVSADGTIIGPVVLVLETHDRLVIRPVRAAPSITTIVNSATIVWREQFARGLETEESHFASGKDSVFTAISLDRRLALGIQYLVRARPPRA